MIEQALGRDPDNLRDVDPRACHQCGQTFQPKRGGYNARYCQDKCKRASQRSRLRKEKPDQMPKARNRHYEKMKKDPVRLERHRETSKSYREKTRKWLADYKLKHGCADCGFKGHFSALELDHEGKKSISIADARTSIKRLKEEIKNGQCVVRCANCHAIKTWERKTVGRGCD